MLRLSLCRSASSSCTSTRRCACSRAFHPVPPVPPHEGAELAHGDEAVAVDVERAPHRAQLLDAQLGGEEAQLAAHHLLELDEGDLARAVAIQPAEEAVPRPLVLVGLDPGHDLVEQDRHLVHLVGWRGVDVVRIRASLLLELRLHRLRVERAPAVQLLLPRWLRLQRAQLERASLHEGAKLARRDVAILVGIHGAPRCGDLGRRQLGLRQPQPLARHLPKLVKGDLARPILVDVHVQLEPAARAAREDGRQPAVEDDRQRVDVLLARRRHALHGPLLLVPHRQRGLRLRVPLRVQLRLPRLLPNRRLAGAHESAEFARIDVPRTVGVEHLPHRFEHPLVQVF
eukprot:scaffold20189_cov58-Phaeocystis_antarctica.AAC.5